VSLAPEQENSAGIESKQTDELILIRMARLVGMCLGSLSIQETIRSATRTLSGDRFSLGRELPFQEISGPFGRFGVTT
jgi:hypothetical protein